MSPEMQVSRSLPPARAAGIQQADGSSASSGAAGRPRAALPGVSAEAVARMHTGPAVAGQAGMPCASSGSAGHHRADIPTGPAAATAQRSASTTHPAAGELGMAPASLAQHTEVRQLPVPTSAPRGTAPRSFGPQNLSASQAPHGPSGGNRQTGQPCLTQHLPGIGPCHPAAKPLQAAARQGPAGPQAASAPAAAASHQGMSAQSCREAGSSHSGVRVAGAPSSVMLCSAAAAGPCAKPAARLQGSVPPEKPSSHCIMTAASVKASQRPALG